MGQKICNLCGHPFDAWDEQENFGFDYLVGYGSKYDLQHITAHFCCGCFDKLLDELTPRFKIPMESHALHLSGGIVWDPDEIAKLAFKPGDRVVMTGIYGESEKAKEKIHTVLSEPWKLCGTWVVMLDGLHGGYAIDGLRKVQDHE